MPTWLNARFMVLKNTRSPGCRSFLSMAWVAAACSLARRGSTSPIVCSYIARTKPLQSNPVSAELPPRRYGTPRNPIAVTTRLDVRSETVWRTCSTLLRTCSSLVSRPRSSMKRATSSSADAGGAAWAAALAASRKRQSHLDMVAQHTLTGAEKSS